MPPLAVSGTRPPFWLMRRAIRSAWLPQADLSNELTARQGRSERNLSRRLGGIASSLLASNAAKSSASMAPPALLLGFRIACIAAFSVEIVFAASVSSSARIAFAPLSPRLTAMMKANARSTNAIASSCLLPSIRLSSSIISLRMEASTKNWPRLLRLSFSFRAPPGSLLSTFFLNRSTTVAMSTCGGAPTGGAPTTDRPASGPTTARSIDAARSGSAATTASTSCGAGHDRASSSSSSPPEVFARSASSAGVGPGGVVAKSSSSRCIVPGPTSPNCSKPSFSFALNCFTAVAVAWP